MGRQLRRKPKVPSSNPPGIKIYFEAKPISNFKNLLEKVKGDDEHDDDDES